MLELGIISATAGALNTTTRTAHHIVDLWQTPAEVEAATAEICACQKKLGEIIELRKKHAFVLADDEAATIEATIATAWGGLTHEKRVLEPNRIQNSSSQNTTHNKISGLGLGRRIQWKFGGSAKYQRHEKAMRRNHTEVRDQINRLEQMVRLGPLEALASRTREDERRREEEMEREREERDIKGLGYLGDVVVVVVVRSVEWGEGEEAEMERERGGDTSSDDDRGGNDRGGCDDLGVPVVGSCEGSVSTLQGAAPSPLAQLPQSADDRSMGLITGLMAEFMALGGDD